MSLEIRQMRAEDLEAVGAIYTLDVGDEPPPDWHRRILPLVEQQDTSAVALVALSAPAEDGHGPPLSVVGYIVGEVRSWEFGSESAAWIFGVGVHPDAQRQGIARALLERAVSVFRRLDVRSIRTMVRRDDVSVLRFFRSGGFVAGPYTELELELDEEKGS